MTTDAGELDPCRAKRKSKLQEARTGPETRFWGEKFGEASAGQAGLLQACTAKAPPEL